MDVEVNLTQLSVARPAAKEAGTSRRVCREWAVWAVPRACLHSEAVLLSAGRCQMTESVGSRVSFFVVGLGIGALIGILFAPKSGEETRDYLSSKADEGRDYAQKKARELRERAEDLLERSKEIMARQKDAVSSAVEAGKETYKREANLS
jgi:gas vesicle protein